MAAVRAVGSQPNPLHIYGGRTCNLLMADWWSDRSPLHEAASQGRLLLLRSLVAQGFHVDTLTMDGVSPLHEACLGGHYHCAKFLLESDAKMQPQQMAPHRSSTPAGAAVLLVLGSSYSTVHPSTAHTSWLHPCMRPQKKITESVWSCCWPAELSWTRSCRKWAPHFILPVEQERLPVWRCCCLQVQMLALDAGGTVLSMPPFREGIWVWWSFCWTLGQTPFTEIQKEGLLWICLHQTARLDLLCREEVCGKRFIRQSVFYKLEPSSTLSSLLRSVLSVSAVPLLHPQTSWTESSAPSPQPFPASQDARLPPLQLMHHLLYLLQTQKCENQSI
ncbi:ankyrin repeat and SOCS box protein 11 isoform X7 [Oryzias latipes]